MCAIGVPNTIAADPVTISVQTQLPGAALSENALGLSYETSLMLADKEGRHYFRPDNKPLVTMFKTLGIKSLRIGGNSVDANSIPIPAEADITSFFEFSRQAGVKVIYSVRLQDGQPQSAASQAGFIYEHFRDQLECFAIGNEPGYYKDYDVYRVKWKAIRDAIAAVFPQARFCGPDQNPSPELCRKMVEDFGDLSANLVQITAHSYPFGCSYKNPSTRIDTSQLIPFEGAACREKMLSVEAYGGYETIRKGLADAVAGTSISFRLTEVNSFWFSGLKGASDSFASALWGLDYLHWWTSNGAAGLNFHTGDRTGGVISMPCMYAAFVSSAAGYEARPLAYGMKMFDLGGHGRSLTVSLRPDSVFQLAAYAVLTDDKTVLMTLINKQHAADTPARDIQLHFDAAPASPQGWAIFLKADDDDISADSGEVTLGGAAIGQDGTWNGQWTPVAVSEKDGAAIALTIPPATAVVVKAKLK